MYSDDPWSWADQKKTVAPLGATIQTATDQAGPTLQAPPVAPDTTNQQLLTMATPAINKAVESGYQGYKAATAANAVAPLSANSVLGTAAPAMSMAPAATGAATTALTEAGITGLAAPLASTTATGAGILGTEAVAGGALATTGATAGASAAGAAGAGALAGGEAALAAMGPVGWAIGAGLLAHKLGIF